MSTYVHTKDIIASTRRINATAVASYVWWQVANIWRENSQHSRHDIASAAIYHSLQVLQTWGTAQKLVHVLGFHFYSNVSSGLVDPEGPIGD